MGHEIEVQAAKIFYDLKDVDAYRKLEALSLSRNYSQFEGYSKESIESDMIKVSSRASSFVRKNREKIQKQM